jgi:hypothetical protein
MVAAPFTATQYKILGALVRLTYGWREKAVMVSHAELTEMIGVANGGGFRRALHELIDEGVVLGSSGLGTFRSTYAIQKDFTRWGKFAIAPGRLASIWDSRPSAPTIMPEPKAPRESDPIGAHQSDPTGTDQSDPPRADQNEGSDPTGTDSVSLQGQTVSPSRDTPTGPKCDTPPKLRRRKDRKDRKDRTTEADAERPTSWMGPYLTAWKEQYGGKIEGGVIGRYLAPLHNELGAEETLRRWTIYLRHTEAKYANPSRFASTPDAWKDEPAQKPALRTVNTVSETVSYLRARVLYELAVKYNVLTYNGNATEYSQRMERLKADPRAGTNIAAELAAVRFSKGIGEQKSEHFAVLEIARRLDANVTRQTA